MPNNPPPRPPQEPEKREKVISESTPRSSLKDWQPVSEEMGFDEEMGTIYFFNDGSTYGPRSIELDCSGKRPWYRFISRLKGLAPTKVSKALLPPKKAFEDYALSLLPKCPALSQSSLPVHPQGRGLRLDTGAQLFLRPFLEHAAEQYPLFVSSKKLEWEEATLPFSIIPGPLKETWFNEAFDKVFAPKKLLVTCAADQLSLEIPRLPDDLLVKDLFCRNLLADLFSVVQSCEALALGDSSDNGKKVHMGQAKLVIRPLLSALSLFFEARLSLRKKAMERFDPVNPHVLALIKCNPFSADIFAASTVSSLLAQSQNQSKSLSVLLNQKLNTKRGLQGRSARSPMRKFRRVDNRRRQPFYQRPTQASSRYTRKSSDGNNYNRQNEQGRGSQQPFRENHNQGERPSRPSRGGRGGPRDRQKRQ